MLVGLLSGEFHDPTWLGLSPPSTLHANWQVLQSQRGELIISLKNMALDQVLLDSGGWYDTA